MDSGTLALTLCLFGASLPVLQAGYERNCDGIHSSPQGYCGPVLSQLLSLLCKAYNKRSVPDDPSQWLADSDGGNHASNAAPGGSVFLPKRDAVSVLQKRSYGQGGIICECCIHRCEVSELQQYCSETDGRSRRRRSVRNILHLDASTLPGLTPEQRQRILKEQRDVADKQMVGRELLRQGPSWWAAAGQLALARAEDELTHAVPGKRQGSHGMKETAVIPDGAQDELQALLHS